MIDVHCHLNFHSFETDYDEEIKRAVAAGVTTIINTGSCLDSSTNAVALTDQYSNLNAIGIVECGMDYYSYQSNGIVDPKKQREVFEKQIELAYKTGLPLQIHNRHAGEDVIEILTNHKNSLQTVPGMFHCFAGTKEVLTDALNLGFYIGFDGNTLYKGLDPVEQ